MRYLALGDSYTIGTSVDASENYPNQLSTMCLEDLMEVNIVATRGWTTADLLSHLPNNESIYDLVSLLIGVNDLYDGVPFSNFTSGVEELIKKSIAYAGGDGDRVRVISIPDYTYTSFATEKKLDVSDQIDQYNDRIAQLSREQLVTFIDITDISRKGLEDPDLIAQDGLHLSGKAYHLIAERLKLSLR